MPLIKSYRDLLDEANAVIETIPTVDAIALAGDPDVVFVDLRDVRELEREGMIPDAFHATRGMIEFWIDPTSPYYKDVFGSGKRVHLLLPVRLALGADDEDGAGHGDGACRTRGGRLSRLERCRRAGH